MSNKTTIFTLCTLILKIIFADTYSDYLILNKKLYHSILQPLSLTSFFRITKTNLSDLCTEPTSTFKCQSSDSPSALFMPAQTKCSICKCPDEKLPFYLKQSPLTDEFIVKLKNPEGIWINLNCGEKLENIEFYDLEENKEGYTGYSGENANLTWLFIHKRPQIKTSLDPLMAKITSGLHSSVTIHVANSFPDCCINLLEEKLNFKLKQTVNVIHSEYSVVKPETVIDTIFCTTERLRNLLVLLNFLEHVISNKYIEIMETLTKLKESNKCYRTSEKEEISYIISLLKQLYPFKGNFIKDNIAKVLASIVLKESEIQEYKNAFIDIQKKLDCIECEKCRLWGKLQINGIVSGFQSIIEKEKSILSEEEIHWIVRTYIKTSNSVNICYEALKAGITKLEESKSFENEL